MDAFLAVASRREQRSYSREPIPEEALGRILDAGRVSGSSRNRQPWRFFVLESAGALERAASAVRAPENVRGAPLAIAIAVAGKGPLAFDAGRAAQNMMLAAWNDGIGSCPNGIADPDAFAELLGLDDGEHVPIVLSFGYPTRPRDPEARSADEWLRRADRRPRDELVRRL